MEVEFGVAPFLDGAQEAEELLVPVPGQTLVDDLSGGDVERREQGRGPVALVAVRQGVPARPFLSGNPGWVRSNACIWLFSSKQKTMARSGGAT